jgi:hypothetical protein
LYMKKNKINRGAIGSYRWNELGPVNGVSRAQLEGIYLIVWISM